jgi:NAD(P)-dependent dehydrogenase (short-subunit alcohol dehydrogenase family)
VIALTKVLAIEYAPSNIRVNCISPGSVLTAHMKAIIEKTPQSLDMFNARSVVGRIGQPEEIAGVAAFLASDDASFMAGSNVLADGGFLITWPS